MKTTQDKNWHLIRNDNGEWISDEYAVFISELEATVLRVYAAKQGKQLSIQHGQDGLLWCYKHEFEAIDLPSQTTKIEQRTLKIKKRLTMAEKTSIEQYKKSETQIEYENNAILHPLRQLVPKAPSGRTRPIALPKYVSFTIEEDTNTLCLYIQEQEGIREGKKVKVNATDHNMQSDNAAFEGWAICLKAWLPNTVNKVELKWDVPSNGETNLHYRRFCYRVIKMLDAYEWFTINETNKAGIDSFIHDLKGLQNNCGTTLPEKKFKHGGGVGENAVEYDMVHEQDFPQKMWEKYGVDNIYHQLPVGIKKDNASFFAGTKAAIDLWGMHDNELTIIELKYKNNMVGIISELFFYVNIIRDIILGRIDKPVAVLEYEKDLYGQIHDMKRIHARMLADTYHPLIKNKAVFDVLNNSRYIDIPIDYNYDSYIYTPYSLEFVS